MQARPVPRAHAQLSTGPSCASVLATRGAQGEPSLKDDIRARIGGRTGRSHAADAWERAMDAVYYIAPTVAMTAYAMLMGVVLMG